ncbi:hypothetical protein QCA50_019663 [Cerrena zonata]|uniref:Cytochrome P450 n=1 Tax=Cerrena zonata TaxID=2478898 RepID=A0AAW0F923_9APHY
MLDIPSVMPWKKFQEWSKVYGDVVFLNLPGQPTVILGSAKAAFELLDKRSDIYSDRPTPIMHKMMSWGWNLALMPYSQRWRDHRREFHQHFNQHEVPKFHQIQLRECRAFLQRVFASPTNDLGQNVRQIFTAIILKIAYDMDISDLRDEYVLLAQEAVEGISIVTVPGICWLEHFPFLRYIPTWVPWTYSKRITEYYRPIVENMVNKPFDEIKQGIVNGQDNHSLVSSIIERIQQRSIEDPSNPIDDKIARNVAGVAYATAADTVSVLHLVYRILSQYTCRQLQQVNLS